MSERGQEFVLWSKSNKGTREGTILDIDTGVLRRDHVLRLRCRNPKSPSALGPLQGHSLISRRVERRSANHCSRLPLKRIERSLAAIWQNHAHSVSPMSSPPSKTRSLRRLALVECLLDKARNPDDLKIPAGPRENAREPWWKVHAEGPEPGGERGNRAEAETSEGASCILRGGSSGAGCSSDSAARRRSRRRCLGEHEGGRGSRTHRDRARQ